MRLLLLGLLGLAIIKTFPTKAQNLFDEQNTRAYAEYLYGQNNYTLAIPEYERLVFFDPDNLSYKNRLLSSYFKNADYTLLGLTLVRWELDPIPPDLSLIYFKSRIRQQAFNRALDMLATGNRFTFQQDQLPALKIAGLGLSGQWKAAAQACEASDIASVNNDFAAYCRIVNEADAFKEKNKLLAAGLSTLVPGLGKVYTRDYFDAVANIIFIGATVFQSYRGFTRDDISDVQGWIYGGIGMSFYLGNVYGSWKAAERYNNRFYESKRKELDNSFFKP